MNDTAAADTLAALCAEPRRYTAGDGTVVEVHPLKVRQLGPFTRALEPLLVDVVALADTPAAEPVEADAGAPGGRGAALMLLVARRAEDVSRVVAIATGCDEQWLGERDLADLAELAAAVLEVNADFFVQRLLPMVQRLLPALTQRLTTLAGGA